MNIIIENNISTIDAKIKNKYIEICGEKELKTGHIFACIQHELKKNNNPSPHVLLQILIYFFNAIKSKDPMCFHKDISRYVLQNILGDNKNNLERDFQVDLLARDFCEVCNKIGDKIFSISDIVSLINTINQNIKNIDQQSSVFEIIEFPTSEIDQKCFKRNLFIPIDVYCKELELIGPNSQLHSKKIKERDLKADSSFWFSFPPESGKLFTNSPAFLGLAKRIWEDRTSKRIQFDEKYPPTVVKPIFKTLCLTMSSVHEKNSESLNLINKNKTVAKIDIPLVPKSLIDKVFKGVNKLNTVIGHKILRYSVNLPFEQKLIGIEDFRTKKFDGGFPEIGREMNIFNKRSINDIREIYFTLNYLDFPSIKIDKLVNGRLIDLCQYKSPKTGREDGLILTILPTLVGIGEIDCSGMLLIPLVKNFPPVKGVAPNQLHANLYLLQMLIFEKFSNNSIELYKFKYIKITNEEIKEFLKKANIPICYVDRILDGWTQDSEDAPKVMKKIDKEHYVLGETYERQNNFLINQGKRRLELSQKGKLGVQKKKGYRRRNN